MMAIQIEEVIAKKGKGDLDKLSGVMRSGRYNKLI